MGKNSLLQGVLAVLTVLVAVTPVEAGVDKEIQNQYIYKYNNRALYLKIPVHGFRQAVIVGSNPEIDPASMAQPLAFKVGDQVRITEVSFKDDYVRFRISSIDLSRESELIFQFPSKLEDTFPQRANFDKALAYALTEGLSYKDIDAAKEGFIKDQFDQLIERFATTTGTSSNFVIQTISEKNPEFQRMRKALAEKDQEVAAAKQQALAAAAKGRESESTISRLRAELAKAERDADSLNEERSELVGKIGDLEDESSRLKAETQRLLDQKRENERQLNQLIQGLEEKKGANAELGSQVQSLGSIISSLKSERGDLSSKLQETTRLVQELQKARQDLSEKLATTERERSKLAADLKELTSDKNSIQARFLKTREERDWLATGKALQSALHLQPFGAGDDGSRVAELFLLTQKIASLRVQPPKETGVGYRIEFEADSPDTVKFSDEERRLYAALGEKLKVRAAWRSESQSVQVSAASGEPVQAVSPRSKAEWTWMFQGEPDRSVPVQLSLELVDVHEQSIPVAERTFEIGPGGLRALLGGSGSLWGLGIAFLVGAVLAGGLATAVAKRQPGPARQSVMVADAARKDF